jgi:GTP-binding protein HflX
LFERPKGGEKAILVQLKLPDLDAAVALSEFEELALSADAIIVGKVTGSRAVPDSKFFIGAGKAEEVRQLVETTGAELVLINHELSAPQERNLEKLFQCRVVDRSGLILDIFAQRARTFEGKLQVELAQLQHLSTRLIRGWTHLERQKGGIGLRGPGETQLETDRRLLKERIKAINSRLAKVRLTREQNRKAREKAHLPTVSLVGYTNAGKSTLFNKLTENNIFAADQLFATLDPTMRKLSIPGSAPVILADTVGFIRNLPHQLIDAFHATLEETEQASLLLHVIDLADPNWRDHAKAVDEVLKEIKVESIPIIQVFNKIDCLDNMQANWIHHEEGSKVWLSAHTGDGVKELLEAIVTMLYGEISTYQLRLEPHQGRFRANLHQAGVVVEETIPDEGGWLITARMTKALYQQLVMKVP